MHTSIKSIITLRYKNLSASVACLSIAVSGISGIFSIYRNFAFLIACVAGIDTLISLLLKIARSKVEDQEIDDQDWQVPLAYAMGFLMLITLYFSEWLFLGCYGPPGTPVKMAHDLDVVNAIYFSVTTATTLGYGDLVPLTDGAKMLAVVQALTCSIYMTAGLAVLFTKHRKLVKPSSD
jgi:hypothetical protein